jgi:hypothetical protein
MILGYEGYVVAIEKVPRGLAHSGEAHAYDSLIRRDAVDGANEARKRHLLERYDDDKVMIVTHILAYDGGDSRVASSTTNDRRPGARFLYNVYDVPSEGEPSLRTDAGTYSPLLTPAALVSPPDPKGTESYSERGIEALRGSLEAEIEAKLDRAARAGWPYTHLLVGAMGWDNDQEESVRRYNALLSSLLEAARRDPAPDMGFRPLLIGVTWPSVWGWASWFDLGQLVYKLFGYGIKADDADEIGYTLANYLLNGLALDMKAALADRAPFRVVAFGHSFGARLMSRALFSDALLRPDLENRTAAQSVDLFVSLQGAFSINRFIEREGEEGSPYAEFAERQTAILLTTSANDTANPIAYWITQAEHTGGWRGLKKARTVPGVFAISRGAIDCAAIRGQKKIVVVDAESFVQDHNDVLDLEMGELMWSAIRCFAPTGPAPTAIAAPVSAIAPAAGPGRPATEPSE